MKRAALRDSVGASAMEGVWKRLRTEVAQSPGRIQTMDVHPKGFYNLRYRSIRGKNWGFHFLDPPRALGLCDEVRHNWASGLYSRVKTVGAWI